MDSNRSPRQPLASKLSLAHTSVASDPADILVRNMASLSIRPALPNSLQIPLHDFMHYVVYQQPKKLASRFKVARSDSKRDAFKSREHIGAVFVAETGDFAAAKRERDSKKEQSNRSISKPSDYYHRFLLKNYPDYLRRDRERKRAAHLEELKREVLEGRKAWQEDWEKAKKRAVEAMKGQQA
jgi:hypothetical protein